MCVSISLQIVLICDGGVCVQTLNKITVCVCTETGNLDHELFVLVCLYVHFFSKDTVLVFVPFYCSVLLIRSVILYMYLFTKEKLDINANKDKSASLSSKDLDTNVSPFQGI